MLTIDGKQVCESLAEVVNPRRAALAVIDIENVPMWDEGPDRVVFDKVKVLTGAARRRGVPVFYFYNRCNRGLTDVSAAVIRAWLNLGHHPDRLHEEFEPDFDEVRVHPGLEPQEGDHILPKHRGCAFEGTDFSSCCAPSAGRAWSWWAALPTGAWRPRPGAPPTRTTTSPWSATARAPPGRPATRRPCASSGTSGWT